MLQVLGLEATGGANCMPRPTFGPCVVHDTIPRLWTQSTATSHQIDVHDSHQTRLMYVSPHLRGPSSALLHLSAFGPAWPRRLQPKCCNQHGSGRPSGIPTYTWLYKGCVRFFTYPQYACLHSTRLPIRQQFGPYQTLRLFAMPSYL